MSPQRLHTNAVARRMASWLRDGSLRLRDVVGLTDAEMAALAALAESCRRRAELEEAIAVYALLLTHDPVNAAHWSAMADLQRRAGEQGVAVACYELAALLGGRELAASQREALCLEQLGHPELAEELRELAALSCERAERRPT